VHRAEHSRTVSRNSWAEGDTVALKARGAPAILLVLGSGPVRVGDRGVIDLSPQVGQMPGGAVNWLGTTYRVVRPSLGDRFASVRRGAQIVTPKDAAPLVFLAGVTPGAQVAEAGAGSGALTIALASAVGEDGHVTSFDRRADFLEASRANVDRAGLLGRVTFRERDVARDGIDLVDLDSVVLDLPNPWDVVPAAHAALAVGGYAATYTPTYNQLERSVAALRAAQFDEVRALEVIERGLHVADGATRPEFEMLGHTGFLASGRRIE
jgi:tRNA (adenine57-N1/adenine58-N1)-methyltransferase catalytic subunit